MILAINTAFKTAQIALKTPKGTYLKDIAASSKHSENMLKTIDELCEEAGVDIMQVQTMAVVTGPGSFTGLRIGTAIAHGFGAANKDLKFVPISSLDLLAGKALASEDLQEDFVVAINALSDLFFVATFDKEGSKIEQDKMIDKEAFLALNCKIFAQSGDLDAYDICKLSITSEDLLSLAEKGEISGNFVCLDDLMPSYLRLSQAEDDLLKKMKK